MKKTAYFFIIMAAALFQSCIVNDIPYPRIQANFLSLELKGQDGGTIIDSTAMTATVAFPEQVDISSVRVMSYSLTPGASIVGDVFDSNIDLTNPVNVTLSLYQEYTWKIIANQTIERYFEVEGQIGASVIDVPSRRVIVYVGESQPLQSIRVVRAKLGPIGSTTTPALDNFVFDGRSPLTIDVEAYGRTQQWTVYTDVVAVSLRTESVDAWSCVAWVNGIGEAGKQNGVEYRIAGSEEWTRLPASEIISDGGNFTGRITHLSPQTAYQARVYNEEMAGDIIDFTTGGTPQMPNSDFENWWLDKKVWCPWAEDGQPFWGTGNQGATTLGTSNTVPTEDTPSGSGWAAQLETRFVGIGKLGKIAAGNIFVGSYVRTVGTNGVLSFGRSFTERPVKLRGQFKYIQKDISHSSEEYSRMIGQPDTAVIWLGLIDSPEPLEIRTAPNDRNLFSPTADYVVAYGEMQISQTVPNYIPFEFELKYTSTSRKPVYILCVGSASKYGDFFTGGNGSTLYLDDLELIYDY